jgi:hypothetical protein
MEMENRMTRLARRPMEKGLRKAIARLMHLHHQTHPDRLAQRFGLTPFYVRKLYTELPLEEQVSLREALKVFIEEQDTKLTAVLQRQAQQA